MFSHFIFLTFVFHFHRELENTPKGVDSLGLIKIQTRSIQLFVTFFGDTGEYRGCHRVRDTLDHQSVVDRSLHSSLSVLTCLIFYF